MKNIAFYCSDLRILAGTERSTFTIANELANSKYFNVFIFSNEGEKKDIEMEINDSIQFINLDFKSKILGYFRNLIKLNRYLKSNRIDVFVSVEMISIFFTIPVLFFNNNKRIKFIAWEHFNFNVNLGLKLRDYCRKLAAKYASGIVVLTEKDKDLWIKNLKINGEIINIINPSPFTFDKINYNTESKNIIAIGRLTYQKGFDILIENWRSLKNNWMIDESWQLNIIGSGPDEELLKSLVLNYELDNYINFIPNTNNIKDLYEDSSFLVMTSRFEGLPMTLIEAQSYGLPIVAYDCITGPSEVINSNTGILVEEGNQDEFNKAIFKLINDFELRKFMSMNAKENSKKYSKGNVSKKWIEFLNRI